MKKFNVAIMGATGAVGEKLISILEERNFPVKNLRLLASERSRGKELEFKGKKIKVEELTHGSFKDIDIVLSSAGASRSLEFLPSAVKAGAICIDNTSAFRMDKNVPLVVPEVNPHAIKKHKGIIANPNCSTIQMLVALAPLHKAAKIKRIVVSTYQAVSGAGQNNINELGFQIKHIAERNEFVGLGKHNIGNDTIKYFNYQILFNLIPQIDVFMDNGYTKEEMKMVNETMKILDDDSVKVTATCVRVPVLYAHSESINIETQKKLTVKKVIEILKTAPGVILVDDIANKKYPMPLDCEGKDATFVGRIREDESIKNGLNLWVVADNLRKGAALNAIQIAEYLIKC
ncbi:MAG: aspartate-semialdehyde dehydrogenase [Candidatus Omnitrophica bacterium]|nr:aspartate-semialdehyde dehydrogenase [Candidatus Omnitrophota bacterium]